MPSTRCKLTMRSCYWRLLAVALLTMPTLGFVARAQDASSAVALAPGPWSEPASEFGAVAFTPDGSFTSTWKRDTRKEAESKVLNECVGFRRGKCEVLSFGPNVCAALATGVAGKERKSTYSGGGTTRETAQKVALRRCSADGRGSCELRTALCGDGR